MPSLTGTIRSSKAPSKLSAERTSATQSQSLHQIEHIPAILPFQYVKALQQVSRLVILTVKVRRWQIQDSSNLLHDALSWLMHPFLILIHPRRR
jgi:hypothetical protein